MECLPKYPEKFQPTTGDDDGRLKYSRLEFGIYKLKLKYQEYTINKDIEVGFEINNVTVRALAIYRMNKFLSLQSNMEVGNPFERSKSKVFFRKFGIGLKIDSKDPQELFQPQTEEYDLSDYEIN